MASRESTRGKCMWMWMWMRAAVVYMCLMDSGVLVHVVGVGTGVVIPGTMLGNSPNPDGTIFVSHDFVTEVATFTKTPGAYPYLAVELSAADQIRQAGILAGRVVNLEIVDDRADVLTASSNLINFMTRAQQNKTRYGDIIGVVGSLGDVTTSLAITSGAFSAAHSSISGVFDLLNRVTYPLHLSSGVGASRTADAIMSFVASQGWRTFSLLTSLDVTGRSFRDYVVNSYSSYFSIDQQTFSPASTDQAATLDAALQNIMRLDNRIIIIKATAPSGTDIYNALQRAGMLNNPRYVILGQQFVSALSQLPLGTKAGNVMTVLQPPPTPAQVAVYTPWFTRQLTNLNMSATQRAACMSYLTSRASFIPPIFNTIYTMMYAAGVLWNKSLPINGSNMFRAMSAVNGQAAFGAVRYDNTGFATYDIGIALYNQTTAGFTDIRMIYTGVTAVVNSTVDALRQFRTVSPLVYLDGTSNPPPDRPIYSLVLLPASTAAQYNNQTQARLPQGPDDDDDNNNIIPIRMESGSKLPNGYAVVIADQTGLITPRQTVALWQAALNGNPTINAYVSEPFASLNATTASISGTPSVKLSSNTFNLAIADFSGLVLSARPGSTVSLHFECILPGGYAIVSPAITIHMANCEAGSYIDAKSNVCRPCQDGYETQGVKNALTCVPILHEINSGVTTAFIVLACIGMALVMVVFGYVAMLTKGHSRTIYHYSPTFCMVALAGMALVFASVIGMVINPVSSCDALSVSTWLFNIGFTWTFGSMFAKSYRLYKIFNNILLCMTAISNKQLYTMLAGLTAVDVILLAVWQGVDPYQLNVASYRTCDVGTVGAAIKYTLIGIKGSLLLIGMYLTHTTRRVPSAFNEHKASTVAIYNASVISVVTLGIWFGMKSASGDVTISVVLATGAWIGALSTLCVVFGHLLYDVYQSSGSAMSKGKGKNTAMNVSGVASGAHGAGATGVFDERVSTAQYSILEALVTEIQGRNASIAGDKEFLETYAKLQSVMKSLSTNQQKKNAILQKLAEICADKDYRKRCGEHSAEFGQPAPAEATGIRRDSLKENHSSMELSHARDRKMSQTSSVTHASLLPGTNESGSAHARRSSDTGPPVDVIVGAAGSGSPGVGHNSVLHSPIHENPTHIIVQSDSPHSPPAIGIGAELHMDTSPNNNFI